ncbi:MAG TPA: class I SAM-dependent methyltransferase [Planctomycetota bacterium]|nr:class I SAM-dependent methyltransferase [Planctomycetota bacterium]
MDLAGTYRRQLAFRDWTTALDALPALAGAAVLDLGCGVGDVASLLAQRGARVVGVDANEELLAAARARQLERVEFRTADLRALPDGLAGPVDGIWSSFAVAYFPDATPVVRTWARHLRPGGWIALVEIDDLFAHEPLAERTRALLGTYADEALAASRYDFRMGRRLRAVLERCGFTVQREIVLADREFSCDGPAAPAVLDGWRDRLRGMRLLHAHCGAEYEAVRADLLACLGDSRHRSHCRVRCCIGVR